MSKSMNNENIMRRAVIHELYERPLTGAAIESRSLETIDSEVGSHAFAPDQWEVVRRMIHTTADFSLMKSVRFSPDAIESGTGALRSRARIYVDSAMIRAGLSLERLRKVNPDYKPEDIFCYVAYPDIAAEAAERGLPRSIFAVRKARPVLHGGIAVFGNAPVALLELNRMIMEDGVRPALVVAMPVGFVHVTESKAELLGLDVPYIAVEGRRGGSPLAVGTIHALCSLAAGRGVGTRHEREGESG
ncbi:MAG: precorrin-8X methylmutase [Desulfomonile sp.]|nr:precorrin-8X methylmutase [Desulfomonile sp.]